MGSARSLRLKNSSQKKPSQYFVLSAAAAAAIFRLNIGMLWVLAGSCAAGVALRLTGLI